MVAPRSISPKHRLLLAALALAALALGGGLAASPVIFPDLPDADSVLVDKKTRRLHLIKDGVPYRTYQVAFGANPRGHKIEEGDQKTPEGRYRLDWRNAKSKYYKSIHISYPGPGDLLRAAALNVEPGGQIMVHGLPNWNFGGWADYFFEGRNWTNGCIAVKNHEMDEIWQAVRPGTPIDILP